MHRRTGSLFEELKHVAARRRDRVSTQIVTVALIAQPQPKRRGQGEPRRVGYGGCKRAVQGRHKKVAACALHLAVEIDGAHADLGPLACPRLMQPGAARDAARGARDACLDDEPKRRACERHAIEQHEQLVLARDGHRVSDLVSAIARVVQAPLRRGAPAEDDAEALAARAARRATHVERTDRELGRHTDGRFGKPSALYDAIGGDAAW